MEILESIYNGKSKEVFSTSETDTVVIRYKDDVTAFSGLKTGNIDGKGSINNQICSALFAKLNEAGLPTHFIERISDNEMAVRRAEVISLNVIVRNRAAGSMAKKLGIAEGTPFSMPVLEINYEDEDLGYPFINKYYAVALELASYEEVERMEQMSLVANKLLQKTFFEIGIDLIDVKFSFGRDTKTGEIIFVDELSPDTLRLWDSKSGEKLDKDRFRMDDEDVDFAYKTVYERFFL